MVNRCDFSFVSQNISFGVEYSNTVVKLAENRDGNLPAFNAYNIVINKFIKLTFNEVYILFSFENSDYTCFQVSFKTDWNQHFPLQVVRLS